MSLRLNRVNEAIEHEINRILRTYFREETVSITVVGALISPDFKFVQVKFSVIDGSTDQYAIKFFSKHKNFIKQKLCKKIRLRHTPQLNFERTDAIAHGNHVINLLNILSETEI
ncbi:MAG: 30S ribosome-binding factor RbfA [Puniceicoccales bacterium]|jgi:ribosome-binding factor A|nr:30S ribosome-binding factor RbfA [Puniceicoccales bacterium]